MFKTDARHRTLDNLKPGDHLAIIYRSPGEWNSAVAEFVTAGLRQGQHIWCYVPAATTRHLRKALIERGLDPAGLEQTGRLRLEGQASSLPGDGPVIASLAADAQRAVSARTPCIRLVHCPTTHMDSQLSAEEVLRFEAGLDREVLAKHPTIALCGYDLSHGKWDIPLAALVAHRLVLADGYVHTNDYYVPAHGRSTNTLVHTLIEYMLQNLAQRPAAPEQLRLLASILCHSPHAFYTAQADGCLSMTSPAFCDLLGYSPGILEGTSWEELVPADWHPGYARLLEELREARGRKDLALEYLHRDGRRIPARISAQLLNSYSSHAVVVSVTDVTELESAHARLDQVNNVMDAVLGAVKEVVAYQDVDMHIRWGNRAAAELAGVSPGELAGARCYTVWFDRGTPCPDCPGQLAVLTGKPQTGEVATPKGRVLLAQCIPVSSQKGAVEGVVEVMTDITEGNHMQKQLRYLSMHDPLTGLHNRAYFEEVIHRLEGGRDYPVTILTTSIDGLKLLNDALGYSRGDALLRAYAGILRLNCRTSDVIARIGGDEFAIVMHRSHDHAAAAVVKRLEAAVDRHNARDPDLPLSASFGWMTVHSLDTSIDEVLRLANTNMHRDKLQRTRASARGLIDTLLAALAAKDFCTQGHLSRVVTMARQLGEAVGLSKAELATLVLFAQVHDLGKVGVPDRVLFKEGPLTSEEQTEMQLHCEIGFQIAKSSHHLAHVAKLILHHHERWDGLGYPGGLAGCDIPTECRILAIVDAYDAMTHDRPYRRARTHQESLAIIKDNSGTQFDPELVEKFLMIMEKPGRRTSSS